MSSWFKNIIQVINRNFIPEISIFVLSAFLFYPNIIWIFKVFFGLYDVFNLLVLISILILIGVKINWKINYSVRKIKYKFNFIPFLLAIISIFIWFYFSFIIDIHILSTSGFLIFIYSLTGLYISPKKWLYALIPFMLILMTLPFGNIMDVYIGFPLRLLSVKIISSIYSAFGIHHITSESIITVENSATQIDFSCSGIKGLWAALIFFFSITWLDNVKIGLAWLFLLFTLITSILVANIFRILVITSLISIFKLDKIAAIIHAPLGIIGFILSCVFFYSMVKLKFYRSIEEKIFYIQLKTKIRDISHVAKKNNWTKFVIIIGLFSLSIIRTKPLVNELKPISINYPKIWNVKKILLTKDESKFFKNQNSVALKQQFNNGYISGSFLIVKSKGWRGHHNPEYCIRAGGNKINNIKTIQINPQFPVKWLKVNKNISACYWFQSPSKLTDDFSTRVWDEIKNKESNWVLVSIIFNETIQVKKNKQYQFIKKIKTLIHHNISQK